MSTKDKEKKMFSYKGSFIRQRAFSGLKKLRPWEKGLLLLPAVAVVVIVVTVMVLLDHSGRFTVSEASYQTYAGHKVAITEGTQLKQNKEGEMKVIKGETTVEKIANLPIYYVDKPSVTFPSDMIYNAPRENKLARVAQFTEVKCDTTGTVYLLNGKENLAVERGFLYDGKDFYLFLEPMTVDFNGYTLDLPALSYIEAVYPGEIMIYNYETEESLLEVPLQEVTAEAVGGDYELSLLGDSLTMYDGSKRLLFSDVTLLDPYEG